MESESREISKVMNWRKKVPSKECGEKVGESGVEVERESGD